MRQPFFSRAIPTYGVLPYSMKPTMSSVPPDKQRLVPRYAIIIGLMATAVSKKAFHKNAKTCRAGFHKKPTKQDGTHMTIRSQITIPTSIFPTTHTIIPYSLFWNGCVYLCVANSRIGLWGLWVGVCIEGSRE